MKKVLLIAYFFPPHPGIGTQRPFRLAKYFQQQGWEIIVLTGRLPGKAPEGFRVIETDYIDILDNIKAKLGFNIKKGMHEQLGIEVTKDFNYSSWKSRIIKLFKDIAAYPDPHKGWYKFALNAAFELIDKEQVDAVISTSYPATSHLIANKIKQKYNIPWIADFRDLWTQNHFYNKFGLIKYFEKKLELKTLSLANVLVTVTKCFEKEFKSLHKDKQVICITNGFDPDDFPAIPRRLSNKFTVTYTGSLYNGKMDPSLLFKTIAQLIDANVIRTDLLEVRFYCHKELWLLNDIKKYNLEGIVTCYGFLPREEVLEKQKESHLLLLLCDKSREVTYYPAKIFEYFGARRPIIAIGGNGGIVKEIIEETNTGIFIENTEKCLDILSKYYNEFINSGKVTYSGNDNIEKYRYDVITKKYSEVLNSLLLK